MKEESILTSERLREKRWEMREYDGSSDRQGKK